jgi:hypothetical protein
MIHALEQLTKDIKNVDIEEILSCWQWRVSDMKAVVTISCIGDIFLLGYDDNIYWLQTDSGDLTKIANSLEEYQIMLRDEENIDNWLLPLLVEKLVAAGKTLKQYEVYSYKILPVIGGEYSIDNIDPKDMSVHFAYSGQICEQIKDLPDGTKVNINFEK